MAMLRPRSATIKNTDSTQDLLPTTTTSTLPLGIKTYAIPFQVPGSRKGRQMLHYFCVQASHDLSGYLSSEFWSRLVLQYSHTEPSVRHALVALTYIHFDFVTHESAGEGGHCVEVLL